MKKVLSFVLVLALVLGSFSMAFAADAKIGLSDIAGNANEDAISIVNGLGIITGYPDGTFAPDKDVTRAEFAAMITRALAIPESALAGYTATAFNDVAGYTWAVPYLAFCETKGIMLGDGNGNVMPGRTINVNEAITMALRAVGYTDNSARLVGTWPANYVTVAKNEGLYTDVDATATVDRASAAQIIYNLLSVQPVAVDADGMTLAYGNELFVALGCTTAAVTVLDYDSTEVRNLDLTAYYGAAGTKYLNDDDEVIAFVPSTKFYTGEFNTTGDAFTVGDVTYKIAQATAPAVINTVVSGAATLANYGDAVVAATVHRRVNPASFTFISRVYYILS